MPEAAVEENMAASAVAARSGWGRPAQQLLVLLIALCICIGATLLEGQDFNWDYRHYHMYGPFAWLGDRLGVDFMAAGPQGYLNPLIHFPLYGMVHAGWSDWSISLALASWHALSLFVLFHIQVLLFGQQSRTRQLVAGLVAVLLAASSPVFLGLVGASFADPLLAPFILTALWAVMKSSGSRRPLRYWLLSGAALGLAIGAKPTSALSAPALVLALWISAGGIRIRPLLLWGGAALLAALATAGPWMWRLYQEFGNPLFPVLNNLFQSPDFTTVASTPHFRFIPNDWFEFLIRPFRMLQIDSHVYIETRAPDVRFATLMVLLLAGGGSWLLSRLRRRAVPAGAAAAGEGRAQWVFWVFFSVSYVIWLTGTGNGRYAFVLLILVAPALITAADGLIRRSDIRNTLIAGTFLAQAFFHFILGNSHHRFTSEPLDGVWTHFEIPDEARNHRFGYVLLDTNSYSIVFPRLDARSGYLGLIGEHVIPKEGPGWARVERFLAAYEGELRVLAISDLGSAGNFELFAGAANSKLAPYGLVVKAQGCFTISGTARREMGPPEEDGRFSLDSCPLEYRPEIAEPFIADYRRTEQAFDNVEKACPRWFAPRGGGLVHMPEGWKRTYRASDTVLSSKGDQLSLMRYPYGPFEVPLGSLTRWAEGPQPLDCKPMAPHYMVGVRWGSIE